MSEIWYYIILLNVIVIGTPFALYYFFRKRVEWLRVYDKEHALTTIKRAVGLFYVVYFGVPFFLSLCSFVIVSLVEFDIQQGFELLAMLFLGSIQVVTGLLIDSFLFPPNPFTSLFVAAGAVVMFTAQFMWFRIDLSGSGFTSSRILKMLGLTTVAIVVLSFVGVQILNFVLVTVLDGQNVIFSLTRHIPVDRLTLVFSLEEY